MELACWKVGEEADTKVEGGVQAFSVELNIFSGDRKCDECRFHLKAEA